MSSKIFISWSGELSEKLGEAIRDWLPSVLQYVKPYFTPDDIAKGTNWNSNISKELESSNIGIICLTKDNINNPWILFEAGALSKNMNNSHVCPILFDLKSADITGPLTSFQHTLFNEDDFKKMIMTINNASGDRKLTPGVLDDVFEMWWPKLDEKIKSILSETQQKVQVNMRSDRDLLEELLELTRRTSVSSKPIAKGAVQELSETILDAKKEIYEWDDSIGEDISERIDKPFRYICRKLGYSSIYELHKEMENEILNNTDLSEDD